MVSKKQRRINKANVNLSARSGRSAKEQLDLLDLRLGKGIGATKERARLLSEINKDHR